jgi:hypothetical protein
MVWLAGFRGTKAHLLGGFEWFWGGGWEGAVLVVLRGGEGGVAGI